MRLSLEIVMIAVIIVVVAVVVLTIFGGGIGQLRIATDARANCLNQGKWGCETTGTMPAGWDTIPVFTETDAGGNVKTKTCRDLTGKTAKEACTSSYIEGQGIVHKWNF